MNRYHLAQMTYLLKIQIIFLINLPIKTVISQIISKIIQNIELKTDMRYFFLSVELYQIYNFFETISLMSRNYLFSNNKQPLNYQIIDNSQNNKKLIATKFNSEAYQIVHLLMASSPKKNPLIIQYEIYNWNITSNILELNYISKEWNCSIKCEMSASATFVLIQSHQYAYLYKLNPSYLIDQMLISFKKNTISILNQNEQIRKKADINRRNFVYASGKDLTTISYTNSSLIVNVFPIPSIYNFNPNNFVLDTKLYQNKLYILYRSIVTYNIFLYQFQQAQLLFMQYPNNTRLNSIGIDITEVLRFNNNYITKVIRFVRGVDLVTGNMIIWVYNDNEAHKCVNPPCLGFGYEIYKNIVFSSVTATNRIVAFYGKSNILDLKNFRPSLISQQIAKFQFRSNISLVDMVTYSNNTVNKILVSVSGQLFPTVYKLINDCRDVAGYQSNNFCQCHSSYVYNSARQTCQKYQIGNVQSSLDTVYIAFIAICSVLLLTIIFIIYRKIISLQRVRKAWQYNAAQNIIFQ